MKSKSGRQEPEHYRALHYSGACTIQGGGVSVTGIELTVLPVVVGNNREVDVPEQRDPVGVLLLPNRGLCAYTYICTQSFPMEVCVHNTYLSIVI